VTDLELRYRRLLALLPWEHRRRYEDEMLGVLLDGAKEGQRHPRPADTADLLLTAVRLRLRATGRGLGDPRWTSAAALVGALAALAMVGLGVRRIVGTAINSYLWNPPLRVSDGDVFRAAIWVLVVVAAVLGRRWTAACLALAGAAAELAAFGYVNGGDPAFAGYPAVAGLFAAAALAAAAIRSAGARLGARALILGAAAAGVVAFSLLLDPRPDGYAQVFGRYVNLATAWAVPIAAVLGVAALWTFPPAVRRRAVALVAVPASVVVVLYVAPYGTGSDVLATFLLSAPALVLALGVAGVHRREERMRLLDIGRATERNRPVEV
jgi:hypothetical protein